MSQYVIDELSLESCCVVCLSLAAIRSPWQSIDCCDYPPSPSAATSAGDLKYTLVKLTNPLSTKAGPNIKRTQTDASRDDAERCRREVRHLWKCP